MLQVGALKQKIQEARDDLGADRQKLIHSGKVLKDEQTVGELGLSEADFIVCMVTKEVKVSNFNIIVLRIYAHFP
jgi:UV excision repair protein RAD23